MHISAKLLIPLVGTLLLAILVWVLGPLVPALTGMTNPPLESEAARLGVIGLLLVIWLLAAVIAMIRAARRNARLAKAIADPAAGVSDRRPGETAAAANEQALLAERMEGAVELLRRGRLGKGKEFLYQLPWYILIGPPGSGKTTALVKSGLKFPLADKLKRHELRGVGGTRNCDWLLTDEAVLIDTAGRYTTQDSDEAVDSAGWSAFLGLLKETRPRQPINGAVVAVGLSELAAMGDVEREECARAVRRRIVELNEQLGIRFPVYMVFTKADLISGFVEFMGGLSKTERSQVWGATFPLADATDSVAALSRFGPEFDALVARLESWVIDRLQQETDTARRGLIFTFPRQIASLKEPVEEFLAAVFQPSRLEEPPILRGFYLTSGTQEGTPIDRIMATLSSLFGLGAPTAPATLGGGGRSYFLGDLFQKVIFAEAGLVGRNLKGERMRRLVQAATIAAAIGAVAIGFGAWTLSYFNNRTLIAAARAAADDYAGDIGKVAADARQDARLEATLDPLDRLRAVADGELIAGVRQDVTYRFGLYQGGKLETAGRTAYARALEGMFRPRLLARLEDQIGQNLQHADYLYEALKVYLTLGRMTDRTPDVTLIREWMALDWASLDRAPLDPAAAGGVKSRLDRHLTALLDSDLESLVPHAERAALRVDAALVARAQLELSRFPLAERVYAQLRNRPEARRLPEWRIVDAAGPEVARVFRRSSDQLLSNGMPGLHTYEGFHGFLLPALADMTRAVADESWVLGARGGIAPQPHDLARLEREVLTLYLNEYAAQWDRMVASVRGVEIGSGAEAALVMGILSNPVESPLRKLLTEMSRQTTLAKVTPDGAPAASGSVGSRLQGIVGRPRTPEDDKLDLAQRIVDNRFTALRGYVGGGAGGPAPIDNTIRLLGDLYTQLATASQSAPGSSASAAAVAAAQMLSADAARQPKPVADITKGIVEDVNGIMKGVVQRDLNAAWRSEVLPICRDTVANRYPIDATSAQDIALGDFIRLFAPGGAMDGFFATHLQQYVDMSTRPWRLRPTGPTGIRLSRESLLQMERAAAIRDGFFPGGVRIPAVRFEMMPTELDQKAVKVRLNIGGQSLSYDHGPQRTTSFQWPDPQGGSETQISFTGLTGQEGDQAFGPWSLFKLLDRATKQIQSPDRMTVTFRAKSLSATFELRASSIVNPFTSRALREFRCPETL